MDVGYRGVYFKGGAMHLGGYISGLAGKKSSFILT